MKHYVAALLTGVLLLASSYTMLTMARDPQNLAYYYKSYDDQTIRVVHMGDFDRNGKGIKMLSTKSKQTFIDMTDKLK